ncbi:MAG: DNA polymerase III subunit gamma/tau [Microthrixaceae bacterium]
MAYQSLYRRYRPRRFDEVRGQEHVVGALRNAVDNNSVTHAYLFSGPRGTGKTSTARILAKALNCENLQKGEPCCDCTPCQDMEAGRSFDLFELDAASNNGVDAIRDLIERTAVGSPGRTKVYILDEVHMLSPAASNALLKTLEEPPGHVRFVLATTDPQKVLPTIRSRTQHFEFQLLSADELERYVRWIIADADLDVDDAGIAWAVRQGRGSARDTLSALDQVVAAGGVVERTEPIEKFFEALVAKDSGVAILAVAEALAQGHDPRVLAKVFLDSLRDTFLLSLGAEVPHMMADDAERMGAWARQIGTPLLTRAMESIGSATVDMRQAADPRVPFEVALVRLTTPSAGSLSELSERLDKLERAMANGSPIVVADRQAGTATGAASPGTEQARANEPAGDIGAESTPGPADAGTDRPSPSGQRSRTSEGPSRDGMSHAARARAELARHSSESAEKTDLNRRPTRATPKSTSAGGPPPVPPSSRRPQAGTAETGEPAESAQAGSSPEPTSDAPSPSPQAPPEPPPVSTPPAPTGAAPTTAAPADRAPTGAAPTGLEGASPGAESSPEHELSDVPDIESPTSQGGQVEPPAPTSTAGAGSDGELSVGDLQSALETAVLTQIRGVTKAIYAQGHFLSIAHGTAVFVVENAPTRERAEKSRTEIESLLSAHLGRPVSLKVTDKDSVGGFADGGQADAGQSGAGRAGATGSAHPPGASPNDHRGPATSRRPGSQELPAGEMPLDRPDEPSEFDEEQELMAIDVTELEDAKGVAETGLDRLLSAFPGATVIESNEEQP